MDIMLKFTTKQIGNFLKITGKHYKDGNDLDSKVMILTM